MPITPLTLNLNATDPAAPTGHQNLIWAADGMNVTAYDPNFTGDSGSGGKAGNVPAPGAGDAAALKYLKADGTWTAPPSPVGSWAGYTPVMGGSGSMTVSGTSIQFAEYLVVGPITFFHFVLSVTLGGTASGSITATAPQTSAAGGNSPIGCSIGTPFQPSFAYINAGSSTITIFAPSGGAFTLGTVYVCIDGFLRNT